MPWGVRGEKNETNRLSKARSRLTDRVRFRFQTNAERRWFIEKRLFCAEVLFFYIREFHSKQQQTLTHTQYLHDCATEHCVYRVLNKEHPGCSCPPTPSLIVAPAQPFWCFVEMMMVDLRVGALHKWEKGRKENSLEKQTGVAPISGKIIAIQSEVIELCYRFVGCPFWGTSWGW